jgi:Pumilio-family RNA binding repeat
MKFVNVNLKEFTGQFYSLSKDQFGCRFLQKQVETHPEATKLVFFEIFPNLIELMVGKKV